MVSMTNSNNLELERRGNLVAEENLNQYPGFLPTGLYRDTRLSGDDNVDRPVDESVSLKGSVEARVLMELDDEAPEGGVNDLESSGSGKTEVGNDLSVDGWNRRKGREERGNSGVSAYDSMLSVLDENATRGQGRVMRTKQSNPVGRGYELGDMVWGKVRSHPWWPGHIYDEAFASPSVRRSKKKGLVLVAFFGDSSYGWFDPDELIPFEPHYAEKSKQINSKTFIKAVEEAVDEASRRGGLGLACRCGNLNNFRPAGVQGYFAVDMGENEPAAVYSADQIKKAQDGFRAGDFLDFMKQLALMPRRDGQSSLDFIKDRAAVLAYRRATYEEFDETYAQAFGQPTIDPTVKLKESSMQSIRAPLSGPMVMAETLGKKKTKKTIRTMDQTNKDKYLFKRRDEEELKSPLKEEATVPLQCGYAKVSTELASGDYILQRRAPPAAPDQQTPANMLDEQVTATDDKLPAVNDFMVKSLSSGDTFSDTVRGGVSVTKMDEEVICGLNQDQKHSVRSKLVEGHQPASLRGMDSKMIVDTGIKKAKIPKRPAGELGVDKSVSGETMKKKRKKDSSTEMSCDRTRKVGSAGKGGLPGSRATGNSVEAFVEHQEKDDQETDSLPNSRGNMELKLVDLLCGLHSLALNPFRCRGRNSSAFVRQVFLKFRSLVFQKSLGLFTPDEAELNENHALRSPPSCSFTSDSLCLGSKDRPSFKPPKPLVRPEDPARGVQKRGPSDRQEELAAKKLKKVNDIKSLSADKKAALRTPEVRGEGKDSVVRRPQKLLTAEPGKKTESQPKVREPTILVMRFPPDSTLPSKNELKARMARFGPMDHTQTGIFWKTSTCRVVFIYKADAEAACRHLVDNNNNNNVFGNGRLRCHTRPLEAPAPYDLEKPTVQVKSCLKKPTVGEVTPATGVNGGTKGVTRVKFMLGGGGENCSVGGHVLSKKDLNRTSFADGGFDASSSPISSSSTSSTTTVSAPYTSCGMDFSSNKNVQLKAVPQNPVSNFHSPRVSCQSPEPAIDSRYPQTAPAVSCNFNMNVIGPSSTNTEIGREMLSLMTRCNDVVTKVRGFFGYLPYHPI